MYVISTIVLHGAVLVCRTYLQVLLVASTGHRTVYTAPFTVLAGKCAVLVHYKKYLPKYAQVQTTPRPAEMSSTIIAYIICSEESREVMVT